MGQKGGEEESQATGKIISVQKLGFRPGRAEQRSACTSNPYKCQSRFLNLPEVVALQTVHDSLWAIIGEINFAVTDDY